MTLRLIFPSVLGILFCINTNTFSEVVSKDTLGLAKDTTSVADDIEENLDDDNSTDSLAQGTIIIPFDITKVPAADLYNKIWNNDIVSPFKADISKFDTAILDLTGYVHPINNTITSEFGMRHWRYHYGIDLRLKVGDSLHCAFDGMVRIAKRSKTFGYYVVVRHPNGLETIYGHLSKILVNVNQTVKAGQIIALGGNTGRSTGPHLHYEMRYLGNNINPHDVVDFQNFASTATALNLTKHNFDYLKEIHKVRYYVVRKGDTLSKIARRYGISVKTLCKLNGIKKTKKVRKGQKLRYT